MSLLDKRYVDRLLSTKSPRHNYFYDVYGWYRWRSHVYTESEDDLPSWLWERLPIDRKCHVDYDPEWWKYYHSKESAMEALQRALGVEL